MANKKPNILVIWGDDIGISNLSCYSNGLMGYRTPNIRVPKVFNLRTDPYERADITSNSYYEWFLYHDYIALAASIIIMPFLETFKDFPPRQKPGSFNLDQALQRMHDVASGAGH